MNEINSCKGFHYWLYENRGKFFCRIYSIGKCLNVYKTGEYAARDQAISAAKNLIDDFAKATNEAVPG